MRLITTLLFLMSFILILPLRAQSEPNIDELIARSKITTFKSIHEVFTPQELTMLREYYHGSEDTNPIAPEGGNTLVYSAEGQTGFFGTFSLEDPSIFDMISTSPANNFEGAGAISNNGEMAYAIDGDNNFYSIDILSGNYSMLGKVTPPNGETFTGLEMDPTDDNKLYAVSSDGAQSSLSTIDPFTQIVTFIALTTLVVAISLAISNTGEMYTMDIDDDKLYQLNKITAAAILIGLIGFDANFGQGMARDAFTGILYMAAFNNTVFDSQLRSVDLLTGLTALIGIIIIGTIAQFGWMGIPNPNLAVDSQSVGNFQFYPNPVGDLLFLKSEEPIEKVSIYNILGQLIYNSNLEVLNTQLDISHFNSGQYLIKATVNGETGIYKFIKQ